MVKIHMPSNLSSQSGPQYCVNLNVQLKFPVSTQQDDGSRQHQSQSLQHNRIMGHANTQYRPSPQLSTVT
jgi:hypothetical protein